MNRYKFLASNTALFFIGSFSSKFLVFLMMPIYTAALSTAEFGAAELMMQTANLLIPIASLGISNSIIRFGLDPKYSKKTVFTTGAVTLFSGFAILLCCYPILNRIDAVQKYIWFLYLYLLMSCLRTLVQQFARAKTYTRLYAFDGILATVFTIGLMYLLLVKFKLGAIGYIMAIIGADFLSTIFLSVMLSIWRYFDLSKLNKKVTGEMLKYCLPLIPASIFWWVTSVSDRYFITYMVSEAANGIYTASAKIPSVIMLFSTIFTESWQISAVTESGEKHTNSFFANVFKAYQSVVFIGGAGLILLCKPIMSVLVDAKFMDAWQYVPVLIIAAIFSCFSGFLSSIYMVEKRGGLNLITMMAGAVANIGLNILLIPKMQAQGAAIATFLSYLLVFTLRAINTKKFININISVLQLIVNLTLICSMSYVVVTGAKNSLLISIAITLVVVLANLPPLIGFLKQLLKALKIKKRKA